MIDSEMRARIRRMFFGENWKIATIAAQLGVHHSTIDLAVERASFVNVTYRATASSLDVYTDFIRATLKDYPRLRSTRLIEMIKQRGYEGTI